MKKFIVFFSHYGQLAGVRVLVEKEEDVVSAFYKKVEAGHLPGFRKDVGIIGAEEII